MGPTGHKQDFPSLSQAPPTPGNLMQAAGKHSGCLFLDFVPSKKPFWQRFRGIPEISDLVCGEKCPVSLPPIFAPPPKFCSYSGFRLRVLLAPLLRAASQYI